MYFVGLDFGDIKKKLVIIFTHFLWGITRVADLHHFSTDPDPAFQLNGDSYPDPDPAPLQIEGNLRLRPLVF